MKKEYTIKLDLIFKNLKIKKNANIHLGIDILKIGKFLNIRKLSYNDFVISIFNYFRKKIGKKGNIVVSVFNFDVPQKKFFDYKKTSGQTGLFGNALLKKFYKNRSFNPIYSFLCFGKDSKKLINLKNFNATGKNSIWKEFIDKNYLLITIGYHYNKSFTHVHYLENLNKVNYRYEKKFLISYKGLNKEYKKKTFTFYARNFSKCFFSAITLKCDNYFFKNKVYEFYKKDELISFKLDYKKASKIILKDLKLKKSEFLSYIKPGEVNKNKSVLYGKVMNNLEKKFLM